MSSFFMHPVTMWVGIALVATPIIIHLINRMRFRRVKWAAMEFLLKAQKKMRRKKILEQLLLLLLRCLLVFLAGLLFARFLGFDPLSGKETRPVLHVVVLDDTPSMADAGEGGAGGDAYSLAKNQVTDKIMTAAAKATTDQRLRIVRLSDQVDILNPSAGPDKDPQRITSQLIGDVRGLLAPERPATVHVGLAAGLRKAREFLGGKPVSEEAKVVHVVSDMRALDWTAEGEAITQAVKELTEMGAKVHLIDVASPYRSKERKTPAFGDNVGIVELKPRTRVAAKDKEVEFDVRVKNYGNTDLKNVMVRFFLNGIPDVITTVNFETLPANQERATGFRATLTQTATKDDPLARYNVVSAVLQNVGSDAIASDNVRHAVVEVRDKLSVLVVMRQDEIDAMGRTEGPKKDGDSYYLRNLFEIKFSGIEWVSATPDALVKRDLREYSSIYLLNVPTLTEAETAQLERYVREGGGVGVFLGDKVSPDAYNKSLYRGGAGFFPVPLPGKPTDTLTAEEKDKRAFSFAKRVLVRESAAKSHPALRGIYEDNIAGIKDTARDVERSFLFAGIYQHWPVARIGRWREDRSIQELYCLPNEAASSEFEGRAVKLIDAVRSKYGEPKFEKYRKEVDDLLTKIRAAVGPDNLPLTELARQMDRLLADQVSEGDANEALLREFWGQPEMTEAKALAQSLRDSAKYGDPLYFARRFGNGRVAVFTTNAGGPWTDWPFGPGSAGWVAVMTELQGYLAGGGSEENRVVGSTLEASFEAGRYKPSVQWRLLAYDAAKPNQHTGRAEALWEPKPAQNPKDHPLDTADGALKLNFADTKKAGVYFFTLTWQKRDTDPPSAPATKPEYAVAVFNPDTEHEGDLRRANSDDFVSAARGAEVHTPDEDYERHLEQRPTDLSSGKWIFLLILLVLIFEQAMAVRLSYHTKPDDLAALAPSAAAAMAGRSAVAAEGEPAPESAGAEGPAA